MREKNIEIYNSIGYKNFLGVGVAYTIELVASVPIRYKNRNKMKYENN